MPGFKIPTSQGQAVQNTPASIVPDAAPVPVGMPDLSGLPPFEGLPMAPAQTVQVVNPYIASGASVNPFAPSKRSFTESKPETDYERERRLYLLGMIESGDSYHATFNREFVRFVLNAPPPENLVFAGKIDGKRGATKQKGSAMVGEVVHIPIRTLYGLLDSTFESWSFSKPEYSGFTVKTKNGEKNTVVCSLTLTVVYPLTGLVRTFSGAADSTLNQDTAAQALLAFAEKNAISKIGRYFGRDLWSDESGAKEYDKIENETKSYLQKLKDE